MKGGEGGGSMIHPSANFRIRFMDMPWAGANHSKVSTLGGAMKLGMSGLLFGIGLAVQAGAGEPSINVSFGNPTHVHRLTYKKLYAAKPFAEATLHYYDNGLYKIVSPGEEHYGVYVVKGDFTAPRYSISYISLPSSDWYGNVALHDLDFDAENGVFGQQAHLPSDQNVAPQDGTFVLEKNEVRDPRPIQWQDAKPR